MTPQTAPAVQAPTPAVTPVSTTEQITGLPTHVEAPPSPAPGTIAAMLAQKKLDKAENIPAPEPNPPKKDKGPKLTLEEVDVALKKALFGQRKEKPTAEPEVEEPVVEVPAEPVAVEEPVVVAPAKKVAKTVTVKTRSDELAEKLADLERQRLELERERLSQEREKLNQPRTEAPTTPAPPKEMGVEDRYRLEVLQFMAKADPKKHGELPSKFIKVAQSTAARKAKWEKEHAGEHFDPNDSEHDEFFSANQVEYDERDYRRAEIKMATDGDNDPRMERLEKENRQIKAKERGRELEVEASRAWAKYAGLMVEGVDADIAKLVAKTPDKLMEEYPVEGEEIMKAGHALEVISKEAYKILDESGLFEPDRNNQAHSSIIGMIRRHEAEIPRRSKEDRQDSQGRDFATWDQWMNLSAQQRANYWHLGPEEIVDILSSELADQIKTEVARINVAVDAKLKKSGQTRTAAATSTETRQEPRSPAASPGSVGRVNTATASKPPVSSEDKFTNIVRRGLFKRSS